MPPPSPKKVVDDLLGKLRSPRITYFPIRHHSPACAAHVKRWIEEHQPASILIEGPESFEELTHLLVDKQCHCPVAVYISFVDKKNRVMPSEAVSLSGPPRFAAYYPFCDYSPELVALRAGHAIGARLRFIDLEYAEKILADQQEPQPGRASRMVDSLTDDPHLRHSEYVQELSRRMGCRDFNELWDHLFESGWDSLDTDDFLDRVATWCVMARLGYTEHDLKQDGTQAREACMASAIQDEMAHNKAEKKKGPILVVTGGFHTVALPNLVAKKAQRPKKPSFSEDECGTWLMRYSFDQLDSLSGYASGMPGPAFYDRMWSAEEETGLSGPEARAQVAADIIVEIGRLTRDRDLPTMISTPDAIAALEMTRELARLRGHPWPMREDVLDGMRSCFVKGTLEVEGRSLLRLVREVLSGDRVGQVPPGTGAPPIVEDFHQEAKRLRLPMNTIESREMVLDLYRKKSHREISRLFHRLDLLNISFAYFRSGPDFVSGTGLDLMQEHWQISWSPACDSALIEASVYGPTVEEAASSRLQEKIADLESSGEGHSTDTAVSMLVRACRMGLQKQSSILVPLIDEHIAGDPDLASVVKGLSQLELLSCSREPLEAMHLQTVPELMVAAYQRACRLLKDIADCPDEMVQSIIGALRALREIVAGNRAPGDAEESLDAELFHLSLARILTEPPNRAQAAIVGASAGILYGEGRLTELELIQVISGYLGGTSTDPRRTCGILQGLLATAREVAWQITEVIQAIDNQFDSWDEETFLQALPDLRLAFADLTPREISRVADHVAQAHGEKDLGELIHMDLDETEVQMALRIAQRVEQSLKDDHLDLRE